VKTNVLLQSTQCNILLVNSMMAFLKTVDLFASGEVPRQGSYPTKKARLPASVQQLEAKRIHEVFCGAAFFGVELSPSTGINGIQDKTGSEQMGGA
jgi:hypothetical protein